MYRINYPTTDDEKGEREAQKRTDEAGHLKIERNKEEVCPWDHFNGVECMVGE